MSETPTMRLDTENGYQEFDPSPGSIYDAMKRVLYEKGGDFLIIVDLADPTGCTYVQAYVTNDHQGFDVEYQDGSFEEHWIAPHLSLSTAHQVIVARAYKTPNWRAITPWERMVL